MKKLPWILLYVGVLLSVPTWAQSHKGITFQGIIKLPNNTYPNLSGLTVNTKVLSPTNCILREEEFTGVNISNGYINLVIGTGNRTGSDPNLTIAQTMNNASTINSVVCLDNNGNVTGTTAYNPATGTGARKLRLRIDALDITADFNMRAIPFAVNAETLNGHSDAGFIKVTTNVTQTAVENLIANTDIQSVLAGTYAAPNVTGTVAIASGGTGATSASGARTALGLAAIASSGSASDLSTGTVATARLGTGTANNTSFLRGDGTWQTINTSGSVNSVAGKTGVVVLQLTDIKDKNGTDYFAPALECTNGSVLKYDSVDDKLSCVAIAINASAITAGTLPLSRGGTGGTDAATARTSLGLAAIASSGSASDLSTGTVGTARLGTGTANNTTYLRGDGTWQTVTGGVSSVAGKAGAVVLQLTDIKDKNGADYFAPALECANGSVLKYDSVDDKLSCVAIAINASAITAGTLPLSHGGTGGMDAATARTSLGLAAIASSGSASDLSTGTVGTARMGTGTANNTTYLRGDGTWQVVTGGVSSVNGHVGTVILKPSDLKDGTGGVAALPTVRCAANQSLAYVSATDLFECQSVEISAAEITSGTLPLSRGGTGGTDAATARTSLGLATIASSGSASDLSAGTVPSARLGTGTADNTTYLRGDGTWSAASVAGSNVTGTVAVANGGTGASTASGARTNLGLAAIASSGSASDLSTGIVGTARMGTGTADNTTFLRGDGAWSAASVAGSNVTGTVAVANGGTGASTASAARTSLGLVTIASSGSASDLSTGTVPTARLGTGTASSSTYLRGDGTWSTVSASVSISGNWGAPSIAVSGASTTGFYADGTDLGVTVGGNTHTIFNSDYIESYRKFSAHNGSASIPHFTFFGDHDSGMYTIADNRIGFSTGGTGRVEIASTGILPVTTATGTVGTSSRRWLSGYFSGAIDTSSDVRLKKDIEESDLGLDFVLDLKPVSWHWKKGKGDSERHYGFIAQEAEKTIQKHTNYADKNLIVSHDKESDAYGIRYSELISPIIKAVQEIYARILGTEQKQAAIETEVANLKAQNQEMQQKYIELLQKVEALEKAK